VSTGRTRQHTILVVDDEESVRRSVIGFLEDEDYRALGAGDGEMALQSLDAEQVDLLLLDVWMSGMDGLEVLERVKQKWSDLPVIMMSGHGSIDLAVRATRQGAYEFLEKPLSPEKLAITISRALDHHASLRAQAMLREELGAGHMLLGESPVMKRLLDDIARVAATDGRVLVVGENGTGKELVARAIHDNSQRRSGPFVRLNSAAIPRDLVESELFGFEKGAFTGAAQQKRGKLELSDRGTLFLDEVGDMEQAAQAKLLRALETGEVERLGGTHTIKFDVRVISATNKDLKSEIKAGRFREDLYYRLAVVPIVVPPLRDRGDDIELLALHFLTHYCHELTRPVKRFAPEAIDVLRAYPWPGNVRELRNLIERLSIMVDGDLVHAHDLTPLLEPGAESATPARPRRVATGGLREQLAESERHILIETLDALDWNVSESARRLGIDRASLHRKIRRFDLKRDGSRDD
jgi:two-component system nitrogen regulation response regulator NtrX